MSILPRSQGVRPGAVGLIFLIVLCLAVVAFEVPQLFTRSDGWAGIPFLVIAGLVFVLCVRAFTTRVRTLVAVSDGTYSILKTLSLTEAFVSLQGWSPEEALRRCFDEMTEANGYEGRVMEANKVSAIMKRSFVRRHVRCSVSVADNALRIQFRLVEGGAIWADGGRCEREIARLSRCLHRSGE